MVPRDPAEPGRSATPLELFFDLVTVVAIAAAAAGLHHAVAEGHALAGVFQYGFAFFAVWWAWMNYTWFASAYDNDDVGFRLLTMGVMGGALVLAAGVGAVFEARPLTLVLVGYVVMRLCMVALWLRAARGDAAGRPAAWRYAVGIALAQVYWVVAIGVWAPSGHAVAIGIGIVLELAVPAWAERSGRTSWHPHHITERYGLFMIIVLGETLVAAAAALRGAPALADGGVLVQAAVSAVVVVFSMWWLYFGREEHLRTRGLARTLWWGYGHVVPYLGAAAVGAGFAVVVDAATGHADVSARAAAYAVAVPVAVYLLGLWGVRDAVDLRGPARVVLPVAALGVLLVPLALGIEGIAAVMVASVVVRSGWAIRARRA